MKLTLSKRERQEYKLRKKVLIITFTSLLKHLLLQLLLFFIIQANDISNFPNIPKCRFIEKC